LVIVTDRKKAEAETARMASETRIIIDAPANVSTFGMDMEGRVNEWNTAAEKLLGYSSDEAMACLLLDFIIPEWQVRFKGVMDDALQGRDTAGFKHPLFTKNGERLDMVLSASPRRDVNGNITGVVAVEQNVTGLTADLKTAEAEKAQMASERSTLIDTANAPIFGIDVYGRINEWNKKSAELVGYATEEVMGKDLVQKFISPAFRGAVKEVFDNALKGLVTSSFEFPLFSKLGTPIELLLSATPQRNATGDIVGVVVVGKDMTEERKALETETDLIKAKP